MRSSVRVVQIRVFMSPKSAALLALILLFTVSGAVPAVSSHDSTAHQPARRKVPSRICGYDPTGAQDELLQHHFHQLESTTPRALSIADQLSRYASVIDEENAAVIADDGSIVIPPNEFDLRGRAIALTPAEGGYAISKSSLAFNSDFGTRLTGFVSVDGRSSDADDGYVEVQLTGATFPFFGQTYDKLFVGTNGYVTMTHGDTSARVSPSVLANGAPRIAPLWTDLDASGKGKIFYNRLEDREVITWNKLSQPVYGGKNTFQLSLYDDGRIVFVYKKAKPHSALVGVSPGGDTGANLVPNLVSFSNPPANPVTGACCEIFCEQKRLDLPALTRAFYSAHPDDFDTVYIWTDFDYDNGLGIAHEFNIRNDVGGIGVEFFDRGALYGSPKRLCSIITMGNSADWPADPDQNMAGLNSAIAIVCHEQGHRWLGYVEAQGSPEPQDSLLGRDQSHWSFFVDTRTRADGTFSSLMEGNAWEGGNGVFTTSESAVNYFSPLDQYLMGLRSADEVGDISYVVTDRELTAILQTKSPLSGFSVNSDRKKLSIQKIISREGPRDPDVANSQKEFRAAFILLLEPGGHASDATIAKMSVYRSALEHYFAVATGRRASLSTSLE